MKAKDFFNSEIKENDWLQTQKQDWDAIVSLPFAFEGQHRRQMAENAVAAANKFQNIHTFELESIRLQYGHLLMEAAMEKADERFYEVYGGIRSKHL